MEGSTERLRNESKQQASALWQDTQETARAVIGEQKHAAAGTLDDFAGTLRRVARESGGGSSQVARLAESAADGLQGVSDALRNKDLDGLLRDVESFARRSPVAFFGIAALAGFAAVRFLKASEPQQPAAGSSLAARSYDSGINTGSAPF